MFNVLEYDVSTNNSAATNSRKLNDLIEKVSNDGGGIVFIPAGNYPFASIHLQSNIELKMAPGVELNFTDNFDDYPVIHSRWEGVEKEVYQSLIYAEEAVNVKITGQGLINGNGQKWWKVFREDRENLKYPRPTAISVRNCENVIIRDVKIIDSPSWTVHPLLSNNVTVDNITIVNPWDSPNTDGINPESSTNIRISNCYIDVGDDCIAIKAGTEGTPERIPCENISITNCNMLHGHGGVVIGSEMSGSVRSVVIDNCVFNDTDRGIRIKTRRGRGGVVENIMVNNIIMNGVMCPIVMNLFYFCGPGGKEKYVWDKSYYEVDERTPGIQDITISNLRAINATAAAGFIYGLPESYISRISFNNVDIHMADEGEPDFPAMMNDIPKMHGAGFWVGNSEEITFNNVHLSNAQGDSLTEQDTKDIRVINSNF